MPNPYYPPHADVTDTGSAAKIQSKTGGVLAVIGSALASFIVAGYGLLFAKLYRVYEEILLSGSADPKLMAGYISESLVTFVIFGLFSSIGLVISIVVVAFSSYRTRWFYILSIVLACINLLYVPVGSLLGVFLLILLFVKRSEFKKLKRNEEEPGART